MREAPTTSVPPAPPRYRRLKGLAAVLLGLAVLVGAAALPLGSHARQVREYGPAAAWVTAGRVAAVLAAMLLMMQFTLSGRLKWLDRSFGLGRLLGFHRVVGATAGVLAAAHPLLVHAPSLPALEATWPLEDQLLGAAALTLVGLILCTSLWRVFLGIGYRTWRTLHYLVFVIVIVVNIHALALGEDLEPLWAKVLWGVPLAAYAGLFVWAKFVKPSRLSRRRYTVTDVTQLTGDDGSAKKVRQITLAAPGDPGKNFAYHPGQFAFLKFRAKNVSREEHHFTISSTPTRPAELIFTIKASGDFTATLGELRPGDEARVDGPYGRFSHRLLSRAGEPLALIAGGVGMTPLLSMLRCIGDTRDERPVTLIWSNRTEADIFCHEELAKLADGLPNLHVHHVLTRQDGGETGRLDVDKLRRLLGAHLDLKRARVFLCGPAPMMDSLRPALRACGIPRRRIHTEYFYL